MEVLDHVVTAREAPLLAQILGFVENFWIAFGTF
jgi:hypothetical protein